MFKTLFALLFVVVVAMAAEDRIKKDVLLGSYASPLAYSAGVYSAGYVPTTYTAGYSALPYAYSSYPYGHYGSYLY